VTRAVCAEEAEVLGVPIVAAVGCGLVAGAGCEPFCVCEAATVGDDAGPTTATQVVEAPGHRAHLTVSPGRIDPTDEAWTDSRKPLAGEFIFGGKKVIVVGNHFNSKGGDQSADGRYQPPTRSSEVQRQQQATVLNNFVHQVLAADPRANIVLAGDFNDYQFSPSMKTLTDNGATLTDLITTLPADQQYTYVFNGVAQVLDHIFVSAPLFAAGPDAVAYDVIHVNSEFGAQASDHDPQVVRIRPISHYLQGTLAGPGIVRVRDDATLQLAGWNPNEPVSVLLDGTLVATATTDATGAATVVLTIGKDVAAGTHTVTAMAPDGVTSATADFEVTKKNCPPPATSPNSCLG